MGPRVVCLPRMGGARGHLSACSAKSSERVKVASAVLGGHIRALWHGQPDVSFLASQAGSTTTPGNDRRKSFKGLV